MKQVLVVAAREISERKRILAAAAVAGLLPFLAPLFPDVARGDVPQVRAIFALVALAAFGIGTAIVLGASVLARDLAERRAAFYFARPLPSLAIWGGKTLGALLLAAGAALLAVLPAWIAAPAGSLLSGRPSSAAGTFGTAGLFFGGLLLLVALSHAAAVAVRSRSPWLVVDLVLLVVCGALAARSALRLAHEGYVEPLLRAAPWGVAALLLLLLAAGAVQVAAGRTDPRRGHGAQSLTIWGVALPVALLGAGFTHWLVSPAPGDLVGVQTAHAAPSSDWLFVEGPARHRGNHLCGFLVNPKAGSFLRLPGAFRLRAVEFTPDGRRALWWELESDRRGLWRLWTADLSAARPEPRSLTVVAEGWPTLGVSPSGRRIALRSGRSLSVLELASEKTLAAVRLDTEAYLSLFFENEETVRLFVPRVSPGDRTAREAPLLELRIPERKLERTGAVPREAGDRLEVWYEAGGARLFALDANRTRLTLRDGRTGELLGTISRGPKISSFRPAGGGAVVALESAGGVLRLHRLAADGTDGSATELGSFRGGLVCGPAADGRLLVAGRTGTDDGGSWQRSWTLLGVDLPSGRITARETGLGPTEPWRWMVDPVLAAAGGPGAAPAAYFLDGSGALVLYDAASGTRTQILPERR
jgi:hypothetical protein